MEDGKTQRVSNREVKSSAFTAFFSVPRNAAELFAALEGQEVSEEDITYTTLEGVLFIARKNDMAFTAKNKVLVISEHQSTINHNMPLRSIICYGRTMEKLVEPRSLYKEKRIPIPTPEFYVFYNGDVPFPAESFMKLSDAYIEKKEVPMLELTVQAIKDCMKEGLMVDFVREHGSEAVNMIFTQWNFEDAMEVRYEEGFEDGAEKGESLRLIKQVQRKRLKGKSVSVISEELEDSVEVIEQICSAITNADTDDIEKIYECWKAME